MISKPACFGNFGFSAEKCATCFEHNVDCILVSLQSEMCFNNAIQMNLNLCKVSACPVEIRTKCNTARHILERIKTKPCFSKPKIKAECFDCDLFEECEIYELIRLNLNLTPNKAVSLLNRQISNMKNEEGQCFGDFSFDEVCWKECQWTVRCMKMSNIIPGQKCKHYSKINKFHPNCDKCDFKKFCIELIISNQQEEKELRKSTKIFRSFYTISEIREFMEDTK